jgi:hypothetical protein
MVQVVFSVILKILPTPKFRSVATITLEDDFDGSERVFVSILIHDGGKSMSRIVLPMIKK